MRILATLAARRSLRLSWWYCLRCKHFTSSTKPRVLVACPHCGADSAWWLYFHEKGLGLLADVLGFAL